MTAQRALPWRYYTPPVQVRGAVPMPAHELRQLLGAKTYQVWRCMTALRDAQAQATGRQGAQAALVCVTIHDVLAESLQPRHRPATQPRLTWLGVKKSLQTLHRLGLVKRLPRRRTDLARGGKGRPATRHEQTTGQAYVRWETWRAVYGAVRMGEAQETITVRNEDKMTLSKLERRGGYRGPPSPEGREKMVQARRAWWAARRQEGATPLAGETPQNPQDSVSQKGPLAPEDVAPVVPPVTVQNMQDSVSQKGPYPQAKDLPPPGLEEGRGGAAEISQKGPYPQVKRVPTSLKSKFVSSFAASLRSADAKEPRACGAGAHPVSSTKTRGVEGPVLELVSTPVGNPEQGPAASLPRRATEPTLKQLGHTQGGQPLTPTPARPVEAPLRAPTQAPPTDRLAGAPATYRVPVAALDHLPGMPRLINATRDGLVLLVPAAPLLDPAQPTTHTAMLVWKWLSSAIDDLDLKRPALLGRRDQLLTTRHKLWPVFAAAAEAFAERQIAPAAWFDYWLSEHAASGKSDKDPPILMFLNERLLRQPAGWHTRLAGYGGARSMYIPEVRHLLRAQQLLRYQLLRRYQEVVANPALLSELVEAVFPGGVARTVERASKRVEEMQAVLNEDAMTGGWVWGTAPWGTR